jgi:hypothetical protein
MSFETMPKIEMDVQPIVSSKQITFSPILRTIESKIREVVAESIVLPFWDDVPFMDTHGQAFRGGIWQRETPEPETPLDIPDESGEAPATPKSVRGETLLEALKSKDDRTMSMSALYESNPANAKVKSRKGLKPSASDLPNASTAAATSFERSESMPLPRAIRSQTFSHAADPVVTTDNANQVVTELKVDEKNSATSAMIEISKRSPPASPNRTPSNSPPSGGIMMPENAIHSRGSSIADSIDGLSFHSDHVIQSPSSARFDNYSSSGPRNSRGSSTTSLGSDKPRRRSTIETLTKSLTSNLNSDEKSLGNKTLGSATAAAKKWSWSVFGKGDMTSDEPSRTPTGALNEPIGRGHPHPPPGAPLPRPDKYALKRNSGTLPKRKAVGVPSPLPEKSNTNETRPVPPPPLPRRKSSTNGARPVPPPPVPRRKPIPQHLRTDDPAGDLLVVQAPYDSAPDSPATGELELDEASTGPSILKSETSSKADTSEVEQKWDDEDGQDPVDHSLSSTPESSKVLPTIEPVQVQSS